MSQHFDSVARRLMKALACGSETQLADRMGIKSAAYFNRKKSGSIFYAEIVAIAAEKGLSLDYLLLGIDAKREPTQLAQSSMDLHVLRLVEVALEASRDLIKARSNP